MSATSAGANPFGGWLHVMHSVKGGGGGNSSAGARDAGRLYVVLCGTLFLEFSTESDAARAPASPRAVREVIGSSASAGTGSLKHPEAHRFTVMTRLGTVVHAAASSPAEKKRWLVALGRGLAVGLRLEDGGPGNWGGAAGASFSIPLPPLSDAAACAETGEVFSLTHPKNHCLSCGGAFVAEWVTKECPLPQHGVESGVRCCHNCSTAQELVTALKTTKTVLTLYAADAAAAKLALQHAGGSGSSSSGGGGGSDGGGGGGSGGGDALAVGGDATGRCNHLTDQPLGSVDPDTLLRQLSVLPLGALHKSTLRHCRRWVAGGLSGEMRALAESGAVAGELLLAASAAAHLAFREHVRALAAERDCVGLAALLYSHRRGYPPEKPAPTAPAAAAAPAAERGAVALAAAAAASSASNGGAADDAAVAFAPTLDVQPPEAAEAAPVGGLAAFADILAALLSTTEEGGGGGGEEGSSATSGAALDGVDFVLPQILHVYFLLLPGALCRTSEARAVLKAPSLGRAGADAPDDDNDDDDEQPAATKGGGAGGGAAAAGATATAAAVGSGRLAESLGQATDSAVRLELLRDFLLALCQRSLATATRVTWALLGYLEDAHLAFDRACLAAPDQALLHAKKASLALLVFEVEATVAELGRPLGSSFGDAHGMFRRLLRPTPAQMAELVREAAALDGLRTRALGLPSRTPLPSHRASHLAATAAATAAATGKAAALRSSVAVTSAAAAATVPAVAAAAAAVAEPGPEAPPPPPPCADSSPHKWRARSRTSSLASDGSSQAASHALEEEEGRNSEGFSLLSSAGAFYRQLAFIGALTEIAESMRNVLPASRADALATRLAVLNASPAQLGFSPLLAPGDTEPCPVVRLPPAEGYVFKTKARAPTLILFEVTKAPVAASVDTPAAAQERTLEKTLERTQERRGSGAAATFFEADASTSASAHDTSVPPAETVVSEGGSADAEGPAAAGTAMSDASDDDAEEAAADAGSGAEEATLEVPGGASLSPADLSPADLSPADLSPAEDDERDMDDSGEWASGVFGFDDESGSGDADQVSSPKPSLEASTEPSLEASVQALDELLGLLHSSGFDDACCTAIGTLAPSAAAAARLADGALESEGVPSGEVARLRTVLAAAAAAPAAAEIVEEAAAQVVVAASEVAEKEMSSADDSAPPQNFFQ